MIALGAHHQTFSDRESLSYQVEVLRDKVAPAFELLAETITVRLLSSPLLTLSLISLLLPLRSFSFSAPSSPMKTFISKPRPSRTSSTPPRRTSPSASSPCSSSPPTLRLDSAAPSPPLSPSCPSLLPTILLISSLSVPSSNQIPSLLTLSQSYFIGPRITLSGASVQHEEFVKLAQNHFVSPIFFTPFLSPILFIGPGSSCSSQWPTCPRNRPSRLPRRLQPSQHPGRRKVLLLFSSFLAYPFSGSLISPSPLRAPAGRTTRAALSSRS